MGTAPAGFWRIQSPGHRLGKAHGTEECERDSDIPKYRSTRRDWRHFQKIKNELLGPEEEAVELYPAESRLVDLSNEYSLWSIKGWKWPIGYAERWVSEGGYEIGGRQRKWDPDDRPADLRNVTKEDIEKYLSGKE